MRNYEVTFIVDPVLSGDEIKATAQTYVDRLQAEGCTIVHVDEMGLRPLAYPINRRSSGVYYCIEFQVETVGGAFLTAIELSLKRDERLLRFLTVQLDKFGVKYNDDKRKGLIGSKKKRQPERVESAAQPRAAEAAPAKAEAAAPVAVKEAPVAAPVVEAAAAPVVEAVAEPVVEAVVAPVAEAVVEPVAEAVAEAEPVVEAAVEPVAEAVAEAETVVEAAVEPVAEAVAEAEPVVEAAIEPVAEAAKEATEEQA